MKSIAAIISLPSDIAGCGKSAFTRYPWVKLSPSPEAGERLRRSHGKTLLSKRAGALMPCLRGGPFRATQRLQGLSGGGSPDIPLPFSLCPTLAQRP
jgi:hypothetical protein